ncbi:MAG: hypothetical protein HW418_1355 [Anaerolineales bacterium]|nr:hypothetical protein [Anaerolineales bacterium]
MSKSKKSKIPKIDPRLLVRPRLDALFDRHTSGARDLAELQAGVEALMAEVSHRPVMDALVKRMEGTPEAERETLMLLVERLRRPEVIEYLWQQVKKPGALSVEAKTTALVILKGMGEDVDISDPGRYFSARDFRPSDIHSVEEMAQMGLRGLARHLRGARDPVEVERLMLDINRMPEKASEGENVLLEMVASAEAEDNDLGADFLLAMARATPYPKVQEAAEAALARLASKGIRPVTPAILSMGQEKFFAAYMTDPDHPWQQSVNVAWERAPGVVQGLVFLLDFGAPWHGAIKDVWATTAMTPEAYHNYFAVKAAKKMGERVYRVGLARAQAAIAAALEANRRNRIVLPKEYNEVRHLVERWVVHPPAAALRADTTADELGDHPFTADHSRKPMVLDLRGDRLEDVMRALPPDFFETLPAEEEEFSNFKSLLKDVREAHQFMGSSPWWQAEWVQDYLSSLHPTPHKLKRPAPELKAIAEQWLYLQDFLWYLDGEGFDVRVVADLRGFHFSDYLAEDALESDADRGRARLETIRACFDYLAQAGRIPSDTPCLPELAQMLAQPDEITLTVRPAPLGGEIAVLLREFGWDREAHDEPLTYNEWWAALVLERKFKGRWDKFCNSAHKMPDAQAKLALLDRLEGRLSNDPDYLDYLDDERPPELEDYKRAERWFEKEMVNEARAW